MTTRKMAVLRLNAPTLRKLLDLPAGAEFVRIDLERFVRGEVHIVVHGVGDEVAEGMPLPPARDAIVTTRTNDSGTVVGTRMDWGLEPKPLEDRTPLWVVFEREGHPTKDNPFGEPRQCAVPVGKFDPKKHGPVIGATCRVTEAHLQIRYPNVRRLEA